MLKSPSIFKSNKRPVAAIAEHPGVDAADAATAAAVSGGSVEGRKSVQTAV